jgi:hypothetical protein
VLLLSVWFCLLAGVKGWDPSTISTVVVNSSFFSKRREEVGGSGQESIQSFYR